MQRLAQLLSRFRKDEGGAFAVIFAVLALALIATSGAVVDFTRMQQARTRAQTALDAAALALQSQINTQTTAQLKAKAQLLLTERLNDTSVTAVVDTATVDLTLGKLRFVAHLVVPTAFVQLVGVKQFTTNLQSEVTQSSDNLEISLSLDITGSMAGSKIDSLKSASKLLISYVIKDTQTPTYTRMAIVPWAAGVNVGSAYAANIRGNPVQVKTISSATWSSGVSAGITAITRASNGKLTYSGADVFALNDWVYISGVGGMTQANGMITQIGTVTTSSNTLLLGKCTTSACGYSTYSSGGTITKCATANCEEVVTTSTSHQISTGNHVLVASTTGMTNFNTYWTITKLTSTTYSAQGSSPTNGVRASGGTSTCIDYGCRYQLFQTAAGTNVTWEVNNCVSERTTNPYNDEPPTTTLLSMNYLSGAAECQSQKIQPLTDDKDTLNALIDTLTIAGSTAGHLGLAWGWYMISPNFAYLWPTGTHQFQPDDYGVDRLVKAIVFMTDGDFNTPFYNGVIAKDALSNSQVATSNRINVNSVNGTSKSQAETICDSIKNTDENNDGKPDILLYTVGFDLAGNTTALNMLQSCATSAAYFFQADDGDELEDAFENIGRSLSELRISK
ncbi:MAG: pilus assembly protein TadG-related protein [Devosia sp.]